MSAFSLTIFGTSGGKWLQQLNSESSTQTPPTCNTLSLLFNLQSYEAIIIYEMLIGNSFALAYYSWKNWQAESSMWRCGKSEETAEHFFLASGLFHDIGPEDIDSLNLLDPEDCHTIVDYISCSTKLNRIV